MNVVVHNYIEHSSKRETQIKARRELPGLCRRLKPISFATIGEKIPPLPSGSKLQSIPMLKANFHLQLRFTAKTAGEK